MKKHEHQLHLRFSSAERDKIAADCAALGYSNRSQYMRDLIQRDFPYIHLFREVVNLVRKQGVLQNQVARYCNQTRQIDEEVLRALNSIAAAEAEILRELRKAM